MVALVDIAVLRPYSGMAGYGRLSVTLGRVSLQGWLEDGTGFVWFEGLREMAALREGKTVFDGDVTLVEHTGSIAGFPVMAKD